MSARVWTSDPVKLAKRRGIGGMMIGGILLVLGAGTAPLWSASSTLAVFGIASLALAVLVFVLSAIALSIARRYPAVRHLGGPNDLATVLVLVVGILGVVLAVLSLIAQPFEYFLASGLLIVMIAVLAGSVVLLAGANRTAIRSEDATGPRP
ncbi:hypothetical protein [Leifsonia sp. Leaf264]|uniref:hypothetical protein n=1 Tax=Leifsonia sp. Leaf264 TaxID=1736314 RepID=UPI0006F977FF|nr:hypothetical protein [Leifsonia sp. Leaf264]KQO96885.1 hypothetical protein ASF30_17595 [Leifsonia sp. Leaf264]